jgi:hypothetical protein
MVLTTFQNRTTIKLPHSILCDQPTFSGLQSTVFFWEAFALTKEADILTYLLV